MALNLTGLFLPALISTLFRSRMEPFPISPPLLDTYDYIVVGSGPAGSVVANRLSEDPSKSVLLLEAGGQDNVTSQIPYLTFLLLTEGYDWNYKTTPQKRCCLINYDKKCNVASGKVLGGSSTIGLMLHRRGMKEDYDKWESQGNTGWSYNELLPFFKKSEDYRINGSCIETDQHNCGGEVVITEIDKEQEHVANSVFLKAAKELGFKEIGYQEPTQMGVMRGTFRIRDGVRQSASTSFLRPIKTRQNLYVSPESFVRKILIDPDTKSAIGVEFEKEGVIKNIKAKREVILSAGTHSSPKILMLSGIGPKEQLSKFNIPVIANSPGVGQNLQERIALPIFFATEITSDENEFISPKAVRKWYKGKGILSTPEGLDAEILLRRNYSDKEADVVDLSLSLQTIMYNELLGPIAQRVSNTRAEIFKLIFDQIKDKNALNIQSILLRPKSKGTVTLASNDPKDYPIIDPNYYSEEIDRKSQIAGINAIYQIINSTTFREQGFKYIPRNFSQCDLYKNPSDEYIECIIQHKSIPLWSGCCTNKMGPDTDKMAVVDHRLRVHGVKNLRVVDASVMPDQVTGTLVPTVIMIGEKAAAMIIEDNQM